MASSSAWWSSLLLLLSCTTMKYSKSYEPPARAQENSFTEPELMTAGAEANYAPDLSPNGAFLFFTSERTGNKNIFEKGINGGYLRQLTTKPADSFSPAVSPDGKRLAFVSRRNDAAGDIHFLDLGGSWRKVLNDEGQVGVFDNKASEDTSPVWLPDNQHIVFVSRSLSVDQPQITIGDTKDATSKALDGVQGIQPASSPDGRYLAFVRKGALFIYRFADKQSWQLTPGGLEQDGFPVFTPNGDGIYFTRYADDTNRDGKLDADDRPSLWFLPIKDEDLAGMAGNPFLAVPITSARYASYYPRPRPPFVYSSLQNNDSLDIFRLPDSGHYPRLDAQHKASLSLAIPDELTRPEDVAYFMRRQAAGLEQQGERAAVKQQLLRELYWHAAQGRLIEARALRAKIKLAFPNDTETNKLTEVMEWRSQLLPFIFPTSRRDLSTRESEILTQLQTRSTETLAAIKTESPLHPLALGLDTLLQAQAQASRREFFPAMQRLEGVLKGSSLPTYVAADLKLLKAQLIREVSDADTGIKELAYFIQENQAEDELSRKAADILLDAAAEGKENPVETYTLIKDSYQKLNWLPAKAHERIVNAYFAQGKKDVATNELRQMVVSYPGSPDTILPAADRLARLEEENGRHEAVEKILERMLSMLAKHPNPKYQREALKILISHHLRHGESLLRAKEPGLAIKVFQKVIAKDPDNVAANKGIIDAMYARKRIDQVITERQRQAEKTPDNPRALYFYGYALTYRIDAAKTPRDRLAAIEDSLALVNEARSMEPNEAAINQTLGWLYYQKHIWLQKRDEQGGIRNSLEKRWQITKDFFGFHDPVWLELSLDAYLAAYYLSPEGSIERANLAQNLGETYYELKNDNKSLRYYATRINQSQSLPFRSAEAEAVIVYKAGRSALQVEEYPLAQQFFKRAISLWEGLKNDQEVNRNTDLLALAYMDAQDYKEAARLYDSLYQANLRQKNQVNAAVSLINEAYCLQKMKDYTRALGLYAEAKKLLDSQNDKTADDNKAHEGQGIGIDLGGQGSAAKGFDVLSRRIQIASFEMDIYLAIGNHHLATEAARSKIALQKQKRDEGMDAGKGKNFYAEELAIAHNNLASLLEKDDRVDEASTAYREAIDWAEKMGKESAVPPRDIWLNTINYARLALRQAVFSPQTDNKALTEARDTLAKRLSTLEKAPRPLTGDGNAFLARALPLLNQMNLLLSDKSDLTKELLAEGLNASVAMPEPETAPSYLVLVTATQMDQLSEAKDAIKTAKHRAANNASLRWKYLLSQGLFREALADLDNQLQTSRYAPHDRELAVYGKLLAYLYRQDSGDEANKLNLVQGYYRQLARAWAKRQFHDDELLKRIDTALAPLDNETSKKALANDEAMLMVFPVDASRSDVFLFEAGKVQRFSLANLATLSQDLGTRLQGTRHLYIIGHSSIAALLSLGDSLRVDKHIATFSFLLHPGNLPYLTSKRTMARSSFAEVAAKAPGLRKIAAAFSYRNAASLDKLTPPVHVVHHTAPVFYSPTNPDHLTFGAGPTTGPDDLTPRQVARNPLPKSYALVLSSLQPYESKAGITVAPNWLLWRNLMLISLAMQVPTTVAFTGQEALPPSQSRDFFNSLAEDSLADTLGKLSSPHVVLGLGGLTIAQEQAIAKERLAETFENGDPAEALRYAQLMGDQQKIDQLLLKLREGRQVAFDYDAALFFQEKIAARAATRDERDHADELLTAGGLAIQAKEFEKAKTYLGQAENIYIKNKDHAQLGITYKFFALMSQGQQDYRQTIAYFEKSRQEHLADDDKDNATARYLDMGNVYKEFLNDYAAALEHYEMAAKEFAAASNQDGMERVAIDKANTLMTIGQTKEAIQILSALLAKVDRDEDQVKWIRTAQILSNAYFRAALFQDATDLNKQIIAEVDNFADEKAKTTFSLDATNLQAMIMAKLGDFPGAMKVFEDGIEPAKRFDMQAKLAQRLNNMGFWAREYGQVDASITYLNEALAIDTQLKSDASIAYDLRNLGLSYIMKGNLAQAKTLLNDALKLSTKLNIAYNATYAEFGLGDVALRENKFDEAMSHFERSLTMAQQSFLQDFIWRAYASMAWTRERQGRDAEARNYYKKAVTMIESLRAGLSSQSSRSGFQSDKGVQEVYGDYVALLMRLKDQEAAWQMSERSRARAFIDSLANQDLNVPDPQKRSLLADEKNARSRMEIAERKWTIIPDNSPEKAKAEADFQALRQQHADIMHRLVQSDPGLAQTVVVDPVTLSELRSLLPKDAALVEYMLHKDKVFIWVIRNGQLQTREITSNTDKLAKDVESFRLLLQSYSSTGFIGSELSTDLLDPIKPLIAGAKRLAIVPHGPLHYLSFAALPYNNRHLLDDFSLYYLESATVSRFTHRGAIEPFSGKSSVFALGNPDVGKDLDLPFAEKEATVIGRYFKDTKVLLGAKASETAFKEGMTQPYNMVHVASHGVFNENTPGNSALVLVKDDKNDGMLSVTEVFGMRIPADLIVLSACETGLGKLGSGDEIVGLNRALFYAGSRSVVSSLWRINDVASAVVVKRLYRYLAQGKDRDEALREAQLLVRQYYPHPAYWAAFRLLGHY